MALQCLCPGSGCYEGAKLGWTTWQSLGSLFKSYTCFLVFALSFFHDAFECGISTCLFLVPFIRR